MEFEIVRRQFAKIKDGWCELEDLQHRGLTADRTWSSFCALIPGDDLSALAESLRNQVAAPHVDIVPSPTAGGVWVMGAHYQLEAALGRLKLPLPA